MYNVYCAVCKPYTIYALYRYIYMIDIASGYMYCSAGHR